MDWWDIFSHARSPNLLVYIILRRVDDTQIDFRSYAIHKGIRGVWAGEARPNTPILPQLRKSYTY
jgi:hypothetical protein